MGKVNLNESFWSDKYRSGDMGWDIGYASTPLKEYIDQLKNKDLNILIPGGGNSYEAEYLFNKGFSNVSVVDISRIPLDNLLKRVPDFPKENLLHQDFFKLDQTYDLILEQTFFCAQDPNLREKYVSKMHQLLKPKGKLVGLLFNIPLNDDKPPFGGSEAEYRLLFEDEFVIDKMETAHNSIPQRAGNEFFIKFIRN
ncbi:MAG TPA: methyltransferase domain-containing protein [Aequorivita sp.]|nr:methyltransferase domain-containing protein [Aequorivita sp.]